MAKKPDPHQAEIDSLRETLRRTNHQLEAANKELDALRSGKPEARAIAESAEVHAASSDNWKAQYDELHALCTDLITLQRYHEANTAPPPDVAQRVRYKLNGQPLQTGVPPKAVAS